MFPVLEIRPAQLLPAFSNIGKSLVMNDPSLSLTYYSNDWVCCTEYEDSSNPSQLDSAFGVDKVGNDLLVLSHAAARLFYAPANIGVCRSSIYPRIGLTQRMCARKYC
jgi:hypothetical protein